MSNEMNQIENIMALHDEAAEAAVDYVRKQMEPWHQQAVVDDSKRYVERSRQALRAAIEAKLKEKNT
jgi:ABC-type branched-subunit amino acid transport system substrate-binding protein